MSALLSHFLFPKCMPNERIKTSTENFRIQVNNRKRRSKLEKHGESVLNNRLSGKKDVWGNFHD